MTSHSAAEVLRDLALIQTEGFKAPGTYAHPFHVRAAAKRAADLIGARDAEIAGLREALIATGRLVGGGLADTVSSEFLAHVPDEVRARLARVTAGLDAAEAAMSIVEPRSNKAQYLEALAAVRAARAVA